MLVLVVTTMVSVSVEAVMTVVSVSVETICVDVADVTV